MGCCLCKFFRKRREPPVSITDEPRPQSFTIDEKDLEFLVIIENGDFGTVKKAIVNKKNSGTQLNVLIKYSDRSHDTNHFKHILNERDILCSLDSHPNIVSLIGLVPARNWIILEYADGGNLVSYLRRHLEVFKDQIVYSSSGNLKGYMNFTNPPCKTDELKRAEMSDDLHSLCTIDLFAFAYQIANGMKYLASVKCTHRDLCLSNILLTNRKTIRIEDFRLARKTEESGYYRIVKQVESLRLLWTAPETIEKNTSNEKSDVWSFAVCLHEMFSLGEAPDAGVRFEDFHVFLKSGGRFNEPAYSPPRIYTFMLWCWKMDPEKRPTFSECFDFFCTNINSYDIHMTKRIDEKLKTDLEMQENQKNWARAKLA